MLTSDLRSLSALVADDVCVVCNGTARLPACGLRYAGLREFIRRDVRNVVAPASQQLARRIYHTVRFLTRVRWKSPKGDRAVDAQWLMIMAAHWFSVPLLLIQR